MGNVGIHSNGTFAQPKKTYRRLVVGIDPGKTTGIAVFNDKGRFVMARELKNMDASDAMVRLYDTLQHLAITTNTLVLICESFELYPGKATRLGWNRMIAPEIIGGVRALAPLLPGNVELVFQRPAIKQLPVLDNNILLPSLGFDVVERVPHAADAARHVVYWLLKNTDLGDKILNLLVEEAGNSGSV